jgi:hypothetical protein
MLRKQHMIWLYWPSGTCERGIEGCQAEAMCLVICTFEFLSCADFVGLFKDVSWLFCAPTSQQGSLNQSILYNRQIMERLPKLLCIRLYDGEPSTTASAKSLAILLNWSEIASAVLIACTPFV